MDRHIDIAVGIIRRVAVFHLLLCQYHPQGASDTMGDGKIGQPSLVGMLPTLSMSVDDIIETSLANVAAKAPLSHARLGSAA